MNKLKVGRINATPKGMISVLERERHCVEKLQCEYHLELLSPNTTPSAKLSECEIILIGSQFKITDQFFKNFPQCSHVITCTSGYDHIDQKSLPRHSCKAYYMPEARIPDVTETTILYILESLKRTFSVNNQMKDGLWTRDNLNNRKRLQGKTIGIVGYGNIGSKVINILSAFNPHEIIVLDPFKKVPELPNVHQVDTLEELIDRAYIVSIHCSLNPSSYHLFNKSIFEKATSPMIIINTARGKVIEQTALYEYLSTNPNSYAFIDVFEKEPLKTNDPLLNLSNIFLTPHCAGYSEDMLNDIPTLVADEVNRIINKQKSPNLINNLK